MKKIISVITALLITSSLSACNGENYTENISKYRIVSSFCMVEREKNGMFTVDSYDYLNFLDFSTMEQVPVCDDPTCKHNVEECSSFGKSNHPFIYKDKLYYFEYADFYQENDIYKISCQLWQSNINGTDEKKIADFNGLNYEQYDRLLICDNMMYMIMKNQPVDKDFKELEPSLEFVSFNLDSHEIKNYGQIIKNYSCGSWVIGMWDNRVIFSVSKSKDNRPYMEKVQEYAEKNGLNQSDAFSEYINVDEYISECYQFDPKTEEITKYEMEEPLEITDNYCFYNNGDELEYLSEDNKSHKVGIKNVSSIISLGKYCILDNDIDTYILNTENMDIYKSNEKYLIGSIIAESGDDLVIQIISEDGLSAVYEKIAVKKIGEKI